MPGVRGPQPPSSGPPPNFNRTRRRHSLPALSSAQLNRLSTNVSKSSSEENKINASRNLPGENSLKLGQTLAERPKSNSVNQAAKPLKPVAKIIVSNDSNTPLDTNGNEYDDENNFVSVQTKDDDNQSVADGTSVLQGRSQTKTNAVFIFRFEEDDEKTKKTNPSDTNISSFTIKPKPSSKPIQESPHFKATLSNTWPQESLDTTSYNLLNSVRFNRQGFCGYKHKQFRESRKFCHIMSPVQELMTPVNDPDYDLDDDWSTTNDQWMDTRSSNGASSPGVFRGRDDIRRRTKPIRVNASSNSLTKNDSESNLSSNLRSALSLSPRRSSSINNKNSLATIRTSNGKSKDISSQSSSPRLRSDNKLGGLESTVGHIFNSLRAGNKTSKPSTSNGSSDDYNEMTRTQLPPRLQTRRRSLSALPDLVKMKGMVNQ